MEMDMKEEQDDLTLVYMFGYKNGKDSMKAENERLRAALLEIIQKDALTGETVFVEDFAKAARAALEGEKDNGNN
jgi:hypothetical protein